MTRKLEAATVGFGNIGTDLTKYGLKTVDILGKRRLDLLEQRDHAMAHAQPTISQAA